LLAAILYQENPDINHKLWNIVLTERYILTNVGVSGMLLHINGKIEIISFAVQFSSYLALIVNFEVYVKA
jgi:hypothetical protein